MRVKMEPAALKAELKRIIDRMFQTRPRAEIKNKPFIKVDGVDHIFRQGVEIKLSEIYPEAKAGDVVYIKSNIKLPKEPEISIHAKGNCDVYFNGNLVFSCDTFEGSFRENLKIEDVPANEGFNDLTIVCTATEEGFGAYFKISHSYGRDVWASDYHVWARKTLPFDEGYDEEGIAISKLYSERVDNPEYVLPTPCEEDDKVDYTKLYTKSGNAVAVSWAKEDVKVSIETHNETRIWVNDDEIEGTEASLKAGDRICVITKSDDNGWGFTAKGTDKLNLPILDTKRTVGTHWLHIGVMGDDFTPDKIQFVKPYIDKDGEKSFWRFARPDMYMRPYLDSSFYGQWYYALMVGEYGILRASDYYPEYYSYFHDSMMTMVRYFDYINYDRAMFGNTTFMPRAASLTNPDMIGAAGMCLCELYDRVDEDEKKEILYLVEIMEEELYSRTPRMEDGAFYRVQTMWADESFMTCPFIMRMGIIKNKPENFDDVVNNLLCYKKRLWMEDKQIFSHIYFPEQDVANRVPWGRGNGWVFFTLIDILERLPKDVKRRDEVESLYKEFAEGLLKYQSDSGMWRQVLDIDTSYKETSGTTIFTMGMLRGIMNGILPEKFVDVVKKSLSDLLDKMIDEKGDVLGVCRGSQCSMNAQYYCDLKDIKNDDHGTGVVIAAICEMIKMLEMQK